MLRRCRCCDLLLRLLQLLLLEPLFLLPGQLLLLLWLLIYWLIGLDLLLLELQLLLLLKLLLLLPCQLLLLLFRRTYLRRCRLLSLNLLLPLQFLFLFPGELFGRLRPGLPGLLRPRPRGTCSRGLGSALARAPRLGRGRLRLVNHMRLDRVLLHGCALLLRLLSRASLLRLLLRASRSRLTGLARLGGLSLPRLPGLARPLWLLLPRGSRPLLLWLSRSGLLLPRCCVCSLHRLRLHHVFIHRNLLLRLSRLSGLSRPGSGRSRLPRPGTTRLLRGLCSWLGGPRALLPRLPGLSRPLRGGLSRLGGLGLRLLLLQSDRLRRGDGGLRTSGGLRPWGRTRVRLLNYLRLNHLFFRNRLPGLRLLLLRLCPRTGLLLLRLLRFLLTQIDLLNRNLGSLLRSWLSRLAWLSRTGGPRLSRLDGLRPLARLTRLTGL